VRVRSRLTEAAIALCFAGLHLGEQHVTGGIREPMEAQAWGRVIDELTGAFKTADVFAAQRLVDRHFPGAQLSLSSLLPGSRERVLGAVLGEAIAEAESDLADAYDANVPLIRWLVAHDLPVPDVLRTTAEATLRRRVLANLKSPGPSFAQLRDHMAEAAEVKVNLDTPEIALAASEALHLLLSRVVREDGALDHAVLDVVNAAAEVAARMRSAVDLWNAQNATWRLLARLPELDAIGDTSAVAGLEKLAGTLRLAVKRP
jgi:hypothetical protein